MRAPSSSVRTIHGIEIRSVERFGADMDALGERAAGGYGSHFTRDAEYFN